MSKKNFIALADAIREANNVPSHLPMVFGPEAIETLADFCQSQNSDFKRNRWLAYIAGECGKNGGAIKPQSSNRVVTALINASESLA